MRKLWKAVVAGWKFLVGVVLCQTPFTAVLVVGWTYRLMQRAALRSWWKSAKTDEDFQAFADAHEATLGHRTYPNWIVAQNPMTSMPGRWVRQETVFGKLWCLPWALTASLLENARVGVAGMVNTWVLTLLPAILWVFGWYAGWDNSFNKGYEQYSVGIVISLIGIALFVVVMLYVPMAQARQAVTGRWRSFYEFGKIRALIRRRRVACLLLAGCYSVASVPVAILIVFPLFIEQVRPATSEMTDLELLKFLNTYFLWTGVVGFTAFVALRVLAARLYAGAVLGAVRAGEVSVHDLSEIEAATLERLGLGESEDRAPRHVAIEVVRKASRPIVRAPLVAATLVVWFTFVSQIYVREFLNYHPVRGWMNQPLVQLPWFRYVPEDLEESARNMP